MSTNQRGIPAAPGYPQYQNTFLIPPVMSDQMLVTFYCESIYAQISTTDALNELKGRGDTVYFLKEPCLTIRDYVKDGKIIYDTMEADTCKFRVGSAKYFGIKIDKLDEMMMANWNRYLDIMTSNAARSFSQRIDCEMLACLVTEADCNNKGAAAGVVSHAYNIGTPGAPVTLTSTNIIEFLSYMQAVLDEQCLPEASRYIILPPQAKPILMNSELKAACALSCGNGTSPIADGQLPPALMSFRLIFTNCAPKTTDVTVSAVCHWVIAGLPMATAFVALADMARTMSDKDSFDTYIAAMMAYGFAVLYPNALAVGYVRFSV